MFKNVLLLLSTLTLCSNFASAIEYQSSLDLSQNADRIAKECQGLKLTNTKKKQCYQTAKTAYQHYLRDVLGRDDSFLSAAIRPQYSEFVVVSIHSYTMRPGDATDIIDYAREKGASGLYVGLTGHRDHGVRLRDIHGKEWIEDTTLITKIAQGLGDKVILAGFSLGGILSIEQAKRNPKLVSGYLAMAPSFHGGELLPLSESSCLARSGFIRGIAEKLSGASLDNEFILGGCAIFRVSKSIASNVQNHFFATYNKKSDQYYQQKYRAKRQMKNLKMPGVIIHSEADQVVSYQVTNAMSEILKEVAGNNFFSYRYSKQDGPRHNGDYTYFGSYLPFSGMDGLDFLFKKLK